MKHTYLGACAVAAGLLCFGSASANDRIEKIVQFSGAIGSQPLAAGANVPNDVLGILPGGRPWELRKFRASVDTQGVLRAKGSGLILGGGSNIGRPAIPRNIQATLICSATAAAPVATSPAWNSVAVALNEFGDFAIDAPLKPVAPNLTLVPPNPCNFPILLIRTSAAATVPGADPTPGAWFAAGIPSRADRGHDDD
ncbi:MAG: hypothetical protein ABL900_15420 [Burkholderiaceae bacterium]